MAYELDGKGALRDQLVRALKQAILGRLLVAGERLPATRELAAEMKLSRNTVLAAYEQLEAEGYLEGRVGSGSYVAQTGAGARGPDAQGLSRPMRRPRLTAFASAAVVERAHQPPGRRRRELRYNLEYGLPLVTPALHSAWRRALGRAADDTSYDYPPAEGLPALRAGVAGYLARRRALAVDPEDVLIVSGLQQGVDLCVRALLQPGARAVIEEPHYQGTRQALLAHGARLLPVAVDADGLQIDKLPPGGARLVCVTPSHQFPSGAVLPLRRRLQLLEWAARHDAWILEDDYDGEFRHDVRPVAALKSLDAHERVLYLGSFSKVMFPALRLGYVVVPPRLREALRACKWLFDRGCPAIEQHALATLIASGQFERLLRRTGRLLAERRAALLAALERHCAGFLEVRGASAGMHLSAWLLRHAPRQVEALIEEAERRDLGIYPISPYFRTRPRRGGLLLGYSVLGPRELAEAARRLGEVLRAVPPERPARKPGTRLPFPS